MSKLSYMAQNKEDLKDLEEELKDAQRAFDDDWYTLITTMNHIQKSYAYLQEIENKLKEFKEQI